MHTNRYTKGCCEYIVITSIATKQQINFQINQLLWSRTKMYLYIFPARPEKDVIEQDAKSIFCESELV